MKLGFTPRRVERGKVCILKGFSRPIVGFDACPTKIDFSLRCSPSKTIVSRKVTSLFHISAVDLIFGMGFVSFFNKKLGLFCYSPKERKRHQWNISIGISMLDFQSPSCRYLQRTLLFLCPMQLHGFEDNCFHWTQISFLSLRIRPSISWMGPGYNYTEFSSSHQWVRILSCHLICSNCFYLQQLFYLFAAIIFYLQ